MLVLGAATWAILLLRSGLPKVEGGIDLPGLADQVAVYRDSVGVPHIYSGSESDLMRAAGFVTAQDRLWQLELARRVGLGRLAEIFGRQALPIDRLFLTLAFRRIAEDLARSLSPEAREALEAYRDGINAYMDRAGRSLPPEFRLLGFRPEPWEIEDSLVILRLVAWELNMAWRTELALGRLRQAVGDPLARAAVPSYPTPWPTVLPPPGFERVGEALLEAERMAARFLGGGPGVGSNSWVVSGDRSVSGKPLLANDPHLTLLSPGRFYEMHLAGGRFDVAGAAIPGLPGIVIGHTRHHAWGFTNGMLDDADFFIEELHPEDPTRYRVGDRWEEMEVWEEIIPVRGAEPEILTVRRTRHGPLVSDLHPAARVGGPPVAFRWTAQDMTREIRAGLGFNMATSVSEFAAASKDFGVPGQNVVYADTAGHIAYWLAAAVPRRNGPDGTFPRRGWTEEEEWEGWYSFDELPRVLDPPNGVIVTANNRIDPRPGGPYLGDHWEPPARAERILELLASKPVHDLRGMADIQQDLLSPLARRLVPAMLEACQGQVHPHLVELLDGWDYRETANSRSAPVFEAALVSLIEAIFQDEMGDEIYQAYLEAWNVPLRMVLRVLDEGTSPWVDDRETPEVESLDEILCQALEGAGPKLAEEGGHPGEITWGTVHPVVFDHPFRQRWPLSFLFSPGPYPRGGSTTTVNMGHYQLVSPFQMVAGPSTRHLVDLARPSRALAVTPPGQSGHPMSPHFKDQIGTWLSGEYHLVVMDSLEVARTGQLLLLLPQGS